MTTKVDDATLVAFVDGELRPAAMARVQEALLVEPQLQQRVEQLRAVDAALDAAFELRAGRAPAAAGPHGTPACGRGASPVAATGNGLGGRSGRGWPDHRLRGRPAGPVLVPTDAPVAAAAIQAQLPEVLESQVSGTVVAFNDPFQGVTGTVKPINTFVNADGRFCRTFEAHATNDDGSLTSRGVACRDDEGKWLTRVQVNAV